MKPLPLLLLALQLGTALFAQTTDTARLRELRNKIRSDTATESERAEFDAGMKARATGSPARTPSPPAPKPSTTPPREEARQQRLAEYATRQEASFERLREMARTALAAAAQRRAPEHPPRAFYVNNEQGKDSATGLAPNQAVRTLAKAVSLLQPGDTLHLAVTALPYRETLHLGDNFGGVPGRPITIDGHGATLTGSDPLRLDGWVEAGAPGLYKSAKFLSELEEFTEEAKLMRVFFIFDGVMQHMGRSSKGNHSRLKPVAGLQPGEWTYVPAEKTFYLKVNGKLADARIEAPYRRNGVAIRAPQAALTHVTIKNLVVCHVLNDGWNLHGTTQHLLLKNIAAYECGDDGISPHETCEVEIDGFWSVGNSTGMGNGYLSVTKARNVRLENNTAHQFMTGHSPVTELRDALIIAPAGTEPVNVSNAQDTHTTFDNVLIRAPAGQKVINLARSHIIARRVTSEGPTWENAGTLEFTDSRLSAPVKNLSGGTATGKTHGTGASTNAFQLPTRPVPHPATGKFTSLR
jgi:hypothetical protein